MTAGPEPVRRQFQYRVVDFARRNAWFGKAFHSITWQRSRTVASFLEPFLPTAGKLLDIGAGTGHVAALLQTPERSVVACDIMDLLMMPLPYVLCDGKRLPFLSGTFNAAVLVTVLHHVPKRDHPQFLKEAARVLKPGGKLVVMEDVYRSSLELQATKLFDSVMNGEFAGHPHANRSLADWVALMTQSGFQVERAEEHVAWYGAFRIRHGIAAGVRV